MNSPIEPHEPECPDEAVLDEYVARLAVHTATAPEQRSNQGDTSALEDHLLSCETCRARAKELASEARHLTECLSSAVEVQAAMECVSLEDLGRYLDGSLTSTERTVAESHLAHCAQCIRALGELYRDVGTILADEAAGAPLFPVDGPPTALTPHGSATTREAPTRAAFSMENWLKRRRSETPSNALQSSDGKQRKPRQSTR